MGFNLVDFPASRWEKHCFLTTYSKAAEYQVTSVSPADNLYYSMWFTTIKRAVWRLRFADGSWVYHMIILSSKTPLSDGRIIISSIITAKRLEVYEKSQSVLLAIRRHSLGGLIACLLVRTIAVSELKSPKHMFITGTTGPSAPSRDSFQRHLLSKGDLIKGLRKLYGCPEEILQDADYTSETIFLTATS